MARYGGGYGGDFYSGPSPFEALVGQALSTFEERKEAKRRKAIEDAQREEQSTTTRLAQAQQRAQLDEQGYSEQSGQIVRTKLSREDQRYTRDQAAKVAERGQKRNDAQGYAAGVGALLDPATAPDQRRAAYERAVLHNPEAAVGLAPHVQGPAKIKKPWEQKGFGTEAELFAHERGMNRATATPAQGSWALRDNPDGSVSRVNATTGQVLPVSGLAGKPGGGKAPTEGEQKSYVLARRGEEANTQLDAMAEQGVNPGWLERQLGSREITNAFASSDTQAFQQAETNFVMAVLRKDSGAQISSGEWEMARKTWIPRPGDEPPVLATKKAARATAIDALKNTTGGFDFASEGRSKYKENPY